MSEQLMWFLIGLVPYYIEWEHLGDDRRLLEVRALFWTFRLESRSSALSGLTLRIPIIERLKEAIWRAVLGFSRREPTQ